MTLHKQYEQKESKILYNVMRISSHQRDQIIPIRTRLCQELPATHLPMGRTEGVRQQQQLPWYPPMERMQTFQMTMYSTGLS